MSLHLNSCLSSKEEAKLKDRLLHAEKCPFHDTVPEMIGPHRQLVDDNFNSSYSDIIKAVSINAELSKEFPAAMFFPTINWTCFCRECAKKNPTPSKHNKFGYGFCSQYSWQAALKNWNSACMRSYKRIIKDNLNIVKEMDIAHGQA